MPEDTIPVEDRSRVVRANGPQPVALKRKALEFYRGVAEMLGSPVPLERDLGLDAEWRVLAGARGFFETTKKPHNGMQGRAVEIEGDRTAIDPLSSKNRELPD